MIHRPILALALAATAVLPLRAELPGPPPVPQAGNNVRCIYDTMSAEDHEIALLLFAREIMAGGKFYATSPYIKVVDRLVDEARVKCVEPYRWPLRRGQAAVEYTMGTLMGDAIGQALQMSDHEIAPIERYFAQHRAELSAFDQLQGEPAARFNAYLIEQGWKDAEEADLKLAEVYLEALAMRARQEDNFSAAPAVLPRAVTRRPAKAAKARRGRT